MNKLINAGHSNSINIDRIVAVSECDSAPIKRMVNNAKKMGMLIDLTHGSKTRAAIVMESGHVILSIKSPETFIKK